MSDAAEARTIGRFDYVIVGAGPAGCVLANRLSADPATRVLLLEAGGRDNYIWIHIPVGYLYCMGNKRTDWCLSTEAEEGLNGRALAYPRGKVLGGCSSINGMIYMRGQARDYDQWRQLGNVGWSWDDVLPYFKRSQDQARGADDMHGVGGEVRVEEQRLSWEILDAFRDAAAEVGIPRTDDFNRGNNEGCGYFQVTQRRGVRRSAARAFLHPVLKRTNLTVMTLAQAGRVRLAGRRATGIEFWRDGEKSFAEAAGEVILAAGAVGSPQLLQVSGIGAGRFLISQLARQRGSAIVFARLHHARRPRRVRVTGPDQHRLRSDAALPANRLAGLLRQAPGNHQGIDAHQRHTGFAIVEKRCPNLACVVKAAVIRFTVSAWLFHSHLGRDVALSKSGLQTRTAASLRQCESGRRDQDGAAL